MNQQVNAVIMQGKYNEQLKQSIDAEYMKINDQTSKLWLLIARDAFKHASVLTLNIAMGEYESYVEEVFSDRDNMRMSVIAALCNTIESRSPSEMNMTPQEFLKVININKFMSDRWLVEVKPIENRIKTRLRIMNGRSN